MTDIVERLRGPAALLTIEEGTKLLGEAADEIKKLRAAVEKLCTGVVSAQAEIEDLKSANNLLHGLIVNREAEIERLNKAYEWHKDGIAERDAEIERLTAALQIISNNSIGTNHWPVHEIHAHAQTMLRQKVKP